MGGMTTGGLGGLGTERRGVTAPPRLRLDEVPAETESGARAVKSLDPSVRGYALSPSLFYAVPAQNMIFPSPSRDMRARNPSGSYREGIKPAANVTGFRMPCAEMHAKEGMN